MYECEFVMCFHTKDKRTRKGGYRTLAQKAGDKKKKRF